ncbi:hypothetical protein SASPL_142524 [Salvia splendens]|uniref:Uncharacterized protein n=1 Tax=Salvia splendens TaxID=180675 RepID=A0A8X8WM24_SALSN|nr:uncharacterized protein LOC121771030 [Salvia splendens]KAG6396376.1 hypothetical protein SASPL_142524 [Salvia splendens]
MRDLQLQTPQRDQHSANRRLRTVSDLNGNLRKTAKKSLNPVLKAQSEDDSAILESPKEFSETAKLSSNPVLKSISEDDSAVLESPKEFSEASNDSPLTESAENFLASVHPAEPQSSESVDVSDLTSTLSSSSSVAPTPCKHVTTETVSTKKPEVDTLKMEGPAEAELVIKHLREARIEVLKSKDIGPAKSIVEALIRITIEEVHGGVHEEDEWLDKLISSKFTPAFLICMLVLCSVLMVGFINWIWNGSFTGPTPT